MRDNTENFVGNKILETPVKNNSSLRYIVSASHENRSTSNGLISIDGEFVRINSDTSLPVIGASETPIIA